MKTYPSKLLLFGEYLVVQGGAALSLPYPRFWGEWRSQTDDAVECKNSRLYFLKLLAHFAQHSARYKLDMVEWMLAYRQGQWFYSNIPYGYGLGSSGAVSAAIYDHYAAQKGANYAEIKADLADVEGFFHGTSSGIDPLTSYIQKPLHILGKEQIVVLDHLPDYSTGEGAIFLLDTQLPRQSAPLIQEFLKKSQETDFLRQCLEPLQASSDAALAAFLNKNTADLYAHFAHISRLQYAHLPFLIPASFQPLWARGLATGEYFLKICGAGGGASSWASPKIGRLCRAKCPMPSGFIVYKSGHLKKAGAGRAGVAKP